MEEKNITPDDVFSQINDILSIKQEMKVLQGKYNTLSLPLLNNTTHLPQILEWYNDVSPDYGKSNRDAKTMYAQCFIFVVVMLYTPCTLAGGKLPFGIRTQLSNILQYKSPTSISNIVPNLIFLYRNYRCLRERVDTAFEYICGKLKSLNLL